MQMSFFNLDDPLLEDIKEEILSLDINTVTYGALMKLNEIKRIPENKFICFKVRVIKRLAFINFFIKKGLCNSIKA
jgi:hypothetical protein